MLHSKTEKKPSKQSVKWRNASLLMINHLLAAIQSNFHFNTALVLVVSRNFSCLLLVQHCVQKGFTAGSLWAHISPLPSFKFSWKCFCSSSWWLLTYPSVFCLTNPVLCSLCAICRYFTLSSGNTQLHQVSHCERQTHHSRCSLQHKGIANRLLGGAPAAPAMTGCTQNMYSSLTMNSCLG